MSLFEMMEVKDPRVLRCIDNYHVHLIAPARMEDEEILKFQSSLREVLLFMKYSKDKENLNRVLKSNEKRFREVERRAVDVIEAITHIGLKYEEEERSVDMCQAIQEIRMESEQIGEEKGRLEQAKETAESLYKLGVDIEIIAQGVNYPVEMVRSWIGLPF